ncbi:MAG: L-histidine N(alpha)-methyltransferase [Candidatus Lustribacter sp.]|jgi:dimethylhistidine N-methyltransferase
MSSTKPVAGTGRFALYRDPQPARVASFAEDVRTGLGLRPYTLMPKYFYDDLGSALFETITHLPEYYLTRVERDLLATYGPQIVAAFDAPLELVELGSGSATKTRLIIDAILERQDELTFHPIDISPDALIESSEALVASIEMLRVRAYAGDYFALLRAKSIETRDRMLALYLGSNVGNFEPPAARELFGLLGGTLKSGDGLLIGYDLKKEASVLELAYDDPTGVTAAFNKNLLARINRELGGDFDLRAFSFFARYDERDGVVRSHLRAEDALTAHIPGAGIDVAFEAGETIHTESSYKFTREDMVALLAPFGFAEFRTFSDTAARYALSLFVRA